LALSSVRHHPTGSRDWSGAMMVGRGRAQGASVPDGKPWLVTWQGGPGPRVRECLQILSGLACSAAAASSFFPLQGAFAFPTDRDPRTNSVACSTIRQPLDTLNAAIEYLSQYLNRTDDRRAQPDSDHLPRLGGRLRATLPGETVNPPKLDRGDRRSKRCDHVPWVPGFADQRKCFLESYSAAGCHI
jgi:hypothetical protein